MTILFLTSDMLFPAKLHGPARELGASLEIVPFVSRLLETVNDRQASLVLIDLGTPRLQVGELVTALRAAAHPPGAIVAFGSHVHEAQLKAAAEAGCDAVLSRGQLHAHATEVLKKFTAAS